MNNSKALNGILRHPPMKEVPRAQFPDATAMPGAMILDTDGLVRVSTKVTPTAQYSWQIPLINQAPPAAETPLSGVIPVYIDAAAPSRSIDDILANPPTLPTRPVNTLKAAADWANIVIGDQQEAYVRIKPGLYDPLSNWECATTLVSTDSSWNVRYPKDSGGGPSTPNNSFPVLASEYGNLSTAVNFTPWKIAFRDSTPGATEFYVIPIGQTMAFGNSCNITGGFNFLSMSDTIRLIREQSNGTLPTYASWLTPAWFITVQNFGFAPMPVVPNISNFSTTLATNLDTFLNAFRSANSRSGQFTCFLREGAIAFYGSKATFKTISDCVFGAVLPCRNHESSQYRESYITQREKSELSINIHNIGIRGNATITSAGIGATGNLPGANILYRGTAAVSAPWTWTQHCCSLMGTFLLNDTLYLDTGTIYWYIQGSSISGGQDATGKWLPNQLFLLDNSGNIATSSNGPFFDTVFLSQKIGLVDLASVYGGAAGATPQFTPPITNRNQGWLGAFGPNGYNSTKTRMWTGGMRNVTTPDSSVREKGLTIFASQTAPFVHHSINGSRSFDSVNSVTIGEGFPAPDVGTGNVVITTDNSGAGLNCGVRDYRGGINSAQGNIIVPDGITL